MKNSIEATIKQLKLILKVRKQEKEIIEYAGGSCMNCDPDIKALNESIEILSDYKRVLKENEILEEEKAEFWDEWNNLERGSYETEQKLIQQIKKLQKENEEYKKAIDVVNKEKADWIRAYQEEKDKQFDLINKISSNDFISKQKIKAKIEELDIAILECEYSDDDSEEYKKEVEKDKLELLKQKSILQELL